MAVRIGIIGCGMIAGFHVRAIAEVDQAEWVGCASRNHETAEGFAQKHGGTAFDSVGALITSNQVDAVSICTPSGAHLEAALAAASAGKHVIVEKPMEINVDRCDQIIDACQRHGVVLATVFQSRFHEASQLLKSALDSGRFGQLALANAYVKWYRTQDYYDSGQWRGTWDLDGGGALMNQAIHNVDLLQWMMGPVNEVTAYTTTLAHERIEVEDTAVAILQFENGALGTIEATTAAYPGSQKRLEIYGSQGSAVIEDEEIQKWEFADSQPEPDEAARQLSEVNQTAGGATDPSAIDISGHRAQFRDFVQAVQEGTQPLIDGREARKSVEIITAIYDSARTGQPVSCRG